MNKFNDLLKRIGLKKIFIILFIVVVATIIFFRQSNKSSDIEYQTSAVEKGTLTSSVLATGSVTSSNIQEVTTQASGVVKKMYVEDGQKVYKGQIIAELELDQVGAQRNASAYSNYLNAVKSLNSAQNNYRSSQASLAVVYDEVKGHDTDETLVMKEKRTKAEVANDSANDGLSTAMAQLTTASLSYNQTSPVIKAPSAGVINLSVTQGSQISAGTSSDASNQRIATITSDGLPIISVSVSEVDVMKVKTNQKVNIILDSIEDKSYTGKVVAMDKFGNSTSDVVTYTALILMDSNPVQILPNMVASVNIITDIKTDVLLVPSEAVSTVNSVSTVQVVKDGETTSVNVEIGDSNDTQTEIISGLNEGDVVITSTLPTNQNSTNTTSPFSGFGGTNRSGGQERNVRIFGGPGF